MIYAVLLLFLQLKQVETKIVDTKHFPHNCIAIIKSSYSINTELYVYMYPSLVQTLKNVL